MSNIEEIQKLLNEKADVQAKISVSTFDGSIEVKTVNNQKYIYVRKREAGKYKSTYVDKYSEELYAMAVNQSMQIRAAKKQLRKIEKELAELGYEENELSSRVRLNIDFARANVKSLIYDQAVLEGVSTTFPQTETILENGIVNGVKASDVQKILNLKHSWEFIVDPDVVASACNFYLLSHIARLVNEGFYENGGYVRSIPVTIGGSSYVPPIPNEIDVKENIDRIIQSKLDDIDKAIELTLYCMKTQIFIDGNKRASIIFANHFMIQNGLGLLVVPENIVPEFKTLLIEYYEGRDETTIKQFLKEKCWRQF
ncbi:Fic family protein [Eubacterium xylanophilum]|uniref:Fic family protein n=1 Tax=Eubacterium xylanophilum TaxID=39497 RepID=UPI00047D769E|nr:Fic family protein [Eubacterium xylanophilum]